MQSQTPALWRFEPFILQIDNKLLHWAASLFYSEIMGTLTPFCRQPMDQQRPRDLLVAKPTLCRILQLHNVG